MDGLVHWPNDMGYALIALILRDGDVWDTLYTPTMSEIEKACEEYNLDVGPIKEQMKKYPDSHTFFIDVALYRAGNP